MLLLKNASDFYTICSRSTLKPLKKRKKKNNRSLKNVKKPRINRLKETKIKVKITKRRPSKLLSEKKQNKYYNRGILSRKYSF